MNARINLYFQDPSSNAVPIVEARTVENGIQIRLLEKAGQHIRGLF